MLKYERNEKKIRQQVTKRGEREKKGNFSPQSLIVKIIESSKSDEERKKEKGIYLLKVETWYGQKPREKKKERKTRLKKQKRREREKEREKELSSSMMKITKDEKRKRKRIRQSMKKKGDKRKVKWEKKGERKKRRENSEMNCLFFLWYFCYPFLLLRRVMSRDIPLGGGR